MIKKDFLFNLGNIFTYLAWAVLLFHLSYIYSTKNPVHYSQTLFALAIVVNGILSLPYSWDKLYLRIKFFVQILVFTILTVGYLYSWVIFKN